MKKILFMVALVASFVSYAQVGINTTAPAAAAKLDVKGKIKITDGMQKDGYVLTSDANGVGSWKASIPLTIEGVLPGTKTDIGTAADKPMGPTITLPPGKWVVYLGFLINGAIEKNSYYAARFTLSQNASGTAIGTPTGFEFINNNKLVLKTFSIGNQAPPLTHSFFASGIISVNVTAASPLKLHVWDADSRSLDSYTGVTPSIENSSENYLFAVRGN